MKTLEKKIQETMNRTKTANQIIKQFAGIREQYFKHLKQNSPYKKKARANMERASKITIRYLNNICSHFNKPVGLKTWVEIGEREIDQSIYKH